MWMELTELETNGSKAKGRSLSREIALSVRFFEDLVRLPNYNICDPKFIPDSRAKPTFPSLFGYSLRL